MRARVIALAGTAGLFLAGPVQSSEVSTARQYIAEARAACTADRGRLWNISLCMPLLLVDPGARTVVASENTASGLLRREGDVFVGTLPKELNVANTAMVWDGKEFAMLLRGALSQSDPYERRRLIMHESWHGVQEKIGLPKASPTQAHLATVEGRAAMRLEWRALSAALMARTGKARRQAVGDALIFRQWRRTLAPDAARFENQLELNEGLAEYTGQKLSGRPDPAAYLVRSLALREKDPSYVRSFAYGSGPAYGLLLDRYDPTWRSKVARSGDLGGLLGSAASTRAVADPQVQARIAGRRYAAQAVLAEEAALDAERTRVGAEWRRKLIEHRGLRIEFVKNSISFNPDTVFSLPPEGAVYPTLRVVDAWGVLEVGGGALILSDWSAVQLPGPAEAKGRRVSGPGWTLDLAEGWITQVGGPGQVRVIRSSTGG